MGELVTNRQVVELCVNGILIETKLKIGKRCKETELTGRISFRGRRSALDCSAMKGDDDEEKEE
jgi:hypothetical protein